MGRKVQRVPLDFSWPINKLWSGFVNQDWALSEECPHCEASPGYSAGMQMLHAKWYGHVRFRPEDRGSKPFTTDHPTIRRLAERNADQSPRFYGSGQRAIEREAARLAELFNGQWCHHLNEDNVASLLEANRLRDLTGTFVPSEGWQDREPARRPTAEEVNEWSLVGFGHDSLNCHIVCEAEAKRLGFETQCTHCDGDGRLWPSAEAKAAYEAWEDSEPPVGDGYQIWETVSEGSPISPVFATPEEPAAHMATPRWGADEGTSYEDWLVFIRGPGVAPSLVVGPNGVESAVHALAQIKDA